MPSYCNSLKPYGCNQPWTLVITKLLPLGRQSVVQGTAQRYDVRRAARVTGPRSRNVRQETRTTADAHCICLLYFLTSFYLLFIFELNCLVVVLKTMKHVFDHFVIMCPRQDCSKLKHLRLATTFFPLTNDTCQLITNL